MQNRLAAYLVLSCAAFAFATPATAGEQPAKTADTTTAKAPVETSATTPPDCATQVWPHFSSACLRGQSSQVSVRQVNLTTASRP
ncbi:hypothetical protein [Bradyrhizobium sp.]|uniref:hypothetical protein n=1 Tax=Bradyrhizobium sp. TaxID=376 RepID=UPI0025C064D6|nr:hypothetical protein [Bradyrhizobium sp.]